MEAPIIYNGQLRLNGYITTLACSANTLRTTGNDRRYYINDPGYAYFNMAGVYNQKGIMSTESNNLPSGYDNEDIRMELYTQYGNHVYESMEEFCCRMADLYGHDWISILNR